VPIRADWDSDELKEIHGALVGPAIARAVSKAGTTALRDMRGEATKRVRGRKRLKAAVVRKALVMRRPKRMDIDGGEWAIDVRGTPVSLSSYPNRQTKKGVSVEVNKGKRTLIKGAFLATMTRAGGLGGSAVGTHGGHTNVYKRLGKERLPIRKFLGSRPVDALLHKGEAEGVQQRGARSFGDTFVRLLPLELEKAKASAAARAAKKGGGGSG
jgi:hypothetical protein